MSSHRFINTAYRTVFLAVLFGAGSLTMALAQRDSQQDDAHPSSPSVTLYYPLFKSHKAIAEAAAKHLPIAWVYGSRADFQAQGEVAAGSSADLTQITFGYLGRMRQDIVIVAIIGRGSLNELPTALRDQFLVPDDGPPGDGETAIPTPKVVITDSSGEVPLNRVSASELGAMRETAIYNAVYSVLHNPSALKILSKGGPEKTVFTEPAQPLKPEPESTQALFLGFIWNVGELFLIMLLVLGVIMFLLSVKWTSPNSGSPIVNSGGKESPRLK